MENGIISEENAFPKLHSHPVIGTIATLPWEMQNLGSKYVLTESFVRWIQAAGARVVPIIPGRSEAYYRDIFEHINGLFIPGGADYPMGTQKPLTDVVKIFLEWSQESLDAKNDYFPIWGTCLGLQALLTLDVLERHPEDVGIDIMKETRMKDKPFEAVMGSASLKLLEEMRPQSKMLSGLSDDIFQVL